MIENLIENNNSKKLLFAELRIEEGVTLFKNQTNLAKAVAKNLGYEIVKTFKQLAKRERVTEQKVRMVYQKAIDKLSVYQ